jgi:hypothetical protein
MVQFSPGANLNQSDEDVAATQAIHHLADQLVSSRII